VIRLATIRKGGGRLRAVRVEDEHAVELPFDDVGKLLNAADWESLIAKDGPRRELSSLSFAPVVPQPEKIICVGQNFRTHVEEMGRDLPLHPTLFAKYARALIGAYDDIVLPDNSSRIDFEAEVAVVIGRPLRRATPESAANAIAGYTIMNDVSARDWQYRTSQWLQGKTFEQTTPLGPVLVVDNPNQLSELEISCEINGEVVQRGSTSDLIFGSADVAAYISNILTLAPGDVIALGTPAGVGQARTPPMYLKPDDVIITRVTHVGECRNACRRRLSAA